MYTNIRIYRRRFIITSCEKTAGLTLAEEKAVNTFPANPDSGITDE
jgi:hypothetical protein